MSMSSDCSLNPQNAVTYPKRTFGVKLKQHAERSSEERYSLTLESSRTTGAPIR